jgi:gliding motility-associated-like protein
VLASPIVNNPYGSSNGGQDIQVNSDNSIYIHQSSGQFAGNPKEIIARLNSNLQMVWQYDFYAPDRSFDGWYQLSSAVGSGIAAIGSGIARGAERALTFLMMDPTGSLCNAGPTALTLSAVNSTLVPLTWNTDANLPFEVSAIPRSLSSLSITSRLFCSQQTICCELNNGGVKLPKDTALCMGTSMVLNARPGYESYQWQNGASGESIRVSNPGIYWVTLTYENGSCKSTDSVQVSSKDCSTNIFFPGAFTPNKDGRNELFKPAITGDMLKYHFVIYNRWGQQIFETNDPLKGWNGSNAGTDQAGGVYVWYCNYQFTGQKENVTKGTCLLIR